MMDSPNLSSIHSVQSHREIQECEELRRAGKSLANAITEISNVHAQAMVFIERVDEFANKKAAEFHLPGIDDFEPFSLVIGGPAHIPNSTLYSLPLTIKNETLRKLHAVLLVSSEKFGYQDVLNIGELEAGQVTKVLYEVSTLEKLVFEVVARGSRQVFQPAASDHYIISASVFKQQISYPYETDFAREKILAKVRRSSRDLDSVALVNDSLGLSRTVIFPPDKDEVFCPLPLSAGPKVPGNYRETWRLQHDSSDCGEPLVVTFSVREAKEAEES